MISTLGFDNFLKEAHSLVCHKCLVKLVIKIIKKIQNNKKNHDLFNKK